VTVTTWLIIGFLFAAAGETTRELGTRHEARLLLFAAATTAMLLALLDHHGVF
jgi:hypothetical protein